MLCCFQTTFQTVDNDRSGYLDRSEFQRALSLLGWFVSSCYLYSVAELEGTKYSAYFCHAACSYWHPTKAEAGFSFQNSVSSSLLRSLLIPSWGWANGSCRIMDKAQRKKKNNRWMKSNVVILTCNTHSVYWTDILLNYSCMHSVHPNEVSVHRREHLIKYQLCWVKARMSPCPGGR